MQTLTSVLGNRQRLDGGAMFGNAPRALWSRWVTPDARHRVDLACRCLLVQEDDRTVLFETGIGAFFEPKLRDRFGVLDDRHVLLDNLAELGLSHKDIDVVVLSHLHFDHAGGLLTPYSPDTESTLLFPNARFIVGADAWARALAPHARDRASFLPHLNAQLAASGRLEIVHGTTSDTLGDGFSFHQSDGHTPGMLLTEIDTPTGPLVFAADAIPGVAWVNPAITMGYDRFPERLIDEKLALLEDLYARDGRLFFTHDPEIASARVAKDPHGRFCTAREVIDFKELFV